MQDAKKRNRRRFADSYLYHYNTLRGGMQEQKIERTARFFGLVWNINKPTIEMLSAEGVRA